MADEEENPMEVPETVFRRGYSRALSALYSADLENAASESNTYRSFEAVLEARGKTIPTLASEFDIRRSIIADLFGGRVSPPLSKRMTEALQRSLAISAEKVLELLQNALGQPRLGMAKATKISAVAARPFEDVIRSSDMSGEKIRYWLDAGVPINADTFIFIDEAEECLHGERIHPVPGIKRGARIHVTRFRRIKATVHFLDQTEEHEFPPGARVRAVKSLAAHTFHMTPADAADHVLQLCGSTERPTSDTPLHELARGGCAVCFDLVPEKRVEG